MPGDKWKWRRNSSKFLWCSKSSSKGKVHSNTGPPQETRKFSYKYLREKKGTNKT